MSLISRAHGGASTYELSDEWWPLGESHLPSINSVIKWRVVARGGRTYPHLIEIFSWGAEYPHFPRLLFDYRYGDRTSRIDKRQEGAVLTTITGRDAK